MWSVVFRCRGRALVTWPTTWPSRWTTRTPSRCRSRASRRQSVGRTCTSCSTSTPSSPTPPASWRRAPQRTVCQVGVGPGHSSSSWCPSMYFHSASLGTTTVYSLIYLLMFWTNCCCSLWFLFFLLLLSNLYFLLPLPPFLLSNLKYAFLLFYDHFIDPTLEILCIRLYTHTLHVSLYACYLHTSQYSAAGMLHAIMHLILYFPLIMVTIIIMIMCS